MLNPHQLKLLALGIFALSTLAYCWTTEGQDVSPQLKASFDSFEPKEQQAHTTTSTDGEEVSLVNITHPTEQIESVESVESVESNNSTPLSLPNEQINSSESTNPFEPTQDSPLAHQPQEIKLAALSSTVSPESKETAKPSKQNAPKKSKRFETTSSIPAGFEDLMSEQTSIIDLYYADRYLMGVMATFSMDTVRIHDPEAVIERLDDLLDPEAIKDALSETLPTNQELRCYSESQRNCGVLRPEVAGIIFDIDTFKGEIFINQSLLSVQQLERDLFLPASDGGLSYLQTLNYAFSGDEDQFHKSSNVFSLSLLSYKENALKMTSNYDDNSGFKIDSLLAQRDWRGIRSVAGYFQSSSQDLRFTAEKPLLGIRIGSSLDTRDDQRQSSGRTIQVFLQSRGDVAIYKDGRLISSQTYDAGNQEIDTRSLPGGAYDIELQISDSAGERIETRFYSKNFRMPAEDQPRYFVELGKVTQESLTRTLPKETDEALLRGSYNQRINHSNALLTGFSTTEDDSVIEAGWFTIGPGYEVLVNSAIARHKRYAFSTETRFNIFNTWLNASYRQIWDKSNISPDNPFDFGPTNLIGEAQKQANLGVSFNLRSINLSLNSRYNKRQFGPSTTDHSARISSEIARFKSSNLRGNLQYNHSDESKTILLSVDWSLRGDHFSSSLSPQIESTQYANGETNNERLSASTNWNSRDLWESELQLGANTSEDRNVRSAGLSADWSGNYGRSHIQIERAGNKIDRAVTRHNGSVNTSFTVGDGGISMGAKDQNQSAVIIDMREAASGLSFDVLINNSRRGTAISGQKTLVSLRPFETYRVRLKPRGSEFVYFNDKEQVVTLYPGNVVKIAWQADRVNILFGRMLDQQDKPITNALLKGVSGLSTTDEFGLFQAEVMESVTEITVETRKQICSVQLPKYTTRSGIASIGSLTCSLADKPQKPVLDTGSSDQ